MKPPTPKPGHPQGQPLLDRLLLAIIDDNRALAKKLIQNAPELLIASVVEARLYDLRIVHWLYANDTALHLAAAGHRVIIAQLLLAAGADPNSARNHRRSRPLHYAADGNPDPSFDPASQVKMIRCLLNAGADLHAVDKNGATALHRAVRTRSADAVECLLQAGADPTAKNRPGATPFHLAAQNTGRPGTGNASSKAAQQRIIKSMLARKVSPSIKDARGKSGFDWATSQWIQQLLSSSN